MFIGIMNDMIVVVLFVFEVMKEVVVFVGKYVVVVYNVGFDKCFW